MKVIIEAEITVGTQHEPSIQLPIILPNNMKAGERLIVVLSSYELTRVLRDAGFVVLKGEVL